MGSRKKKRRNVYLGTRVKDTGKPGLDSVAEVRGIVRAIKADLRAGRISRTLALRRLALLKLIVLRDRDFRSGIKRMKALNIIDKAMAELRR